MIAAERGWSISFAMGGFSVGLLTAGLVAPYVDRPFWRARRHDHRLIDRGAWSFLIVRAATPVAYYAVWMVLGVTMVTINFHHV